MSDREGERLRALQSYRMLDTAPEPPFDDLAALAADLFDAPIALVTLLDEHRQWFKARVGLALTQTPRSQAFCSYALALPPNEVMVVEDARLDPRFQDNPLVTGEPFIRFYAGAVLTDPRGNNLGTLCVIDRAPRSRPTRRELGRLQNLARRVVDLFERGKAERRLAEQQRLMEMTEAMAGVGCWRLHVPSGRVSWSPEMYRIFGVDPQGFEPTAENVFARLGTAGEDGRRALEQAIAERGVYDYQRSLQHPDGRRRDIHSKGVCELDQAGEVVALFGVVQDITELQQAMDTVRRSQARYKLLADNMADVVTRIRLDGSSDYISPAVQALLGYEPREMAGQPAQAFVYPPDVPLVLGAFGELAAGAPEVTLRHRAQHRDGRPVWVETRFRLIPGAAGEPPEMVAVIRDIAAQRTLEEQLEAACDAAEAANRAKSAFLANMSHELRTPLNGVIGFSRLLAESPDLTEADRRRVLLVRNAGEALSSLINDVLDFSKLEAGAVQLEARAFNIGDMVSEALAMVEPQALEKAIALRIAGDDPGVLIGDKHRLRQVLLNFLSNAVKFTDAGEVTVRLCSRPAAASRLRLRVEVADQGVGIAPEKAPLLFRRFSQADSSVSRTYGGTGLGLAISRELIELMGGEVGVDSELGAGATFWFELELPRGDAAPRREKTVEGRTAFRSRRVLVVDDVALNRELMHEMLRQHHCEIDLAEDGAEAVAAVAGGTYDLVLMDLHMPVMDGLAATRAIRAAGFDALPILALTASGAPDQVEGCFAAGMNGHLLKPLSPQDLERALSRAFEAAALAPPLAQTDRDGPSIREAFERSMGAPVALRLARLFQAQLEDHFRSTEREALRQEAHKVAGSAGVLGLVGLGEAARRLESACASEVAFDRELAQTIEAARLALPTLAAWADGLESRAV